MLVAQRADWQKSIPERYRLKRLLGRGGMGYVWQAEDTELDRQIAIKLLPPVLRHEEDYLRSFAEEARMAAALEHPHILPVHDFGEFHSGDDVITYLIIPLISGGSLEDLIKKGKGALSVTTALNYLRQAAQAIDYAHSKNVLHRDIKPANMLLQENWLFLSDFGIAKLLTTYTYRSRTHAGAGTPGYMAPEQIRGKAEQASDLYSLVVVAYQLLTGHLPFHDDDPYEVFLRHLNEAPFPPRGYNSLLPESVEQTLLRGLAKLPSERQPSCLAFVDELEQSWQAHNHLAPEQIDPEATLIAPWSKRALANLPTQLVDDTNISSSPTSLLTSQVITPVTSEEATNIQLPRTDPGNIEQKQKHGKERQSTTEQTAKKLIGRRTLLAGGAAATIFLAGGGLALTTLYQLSQSSWSKKIIAGVPVLKLTGHTKGVRCVRWNPRGRYLASSGLDANVLIWDIDSLIAPSAKQMHTASQSAMSYMMNVPARNESIDWSADGRKLAMIGVQGVKSPAMQIVDIFTPNARPAVFTGVQGSFTVNEFLCLAWSPTSNLVASSHYGGIEGGISVVLWQADQPGKTQKVLSDPTTQIQTHQSASMTSLCWSIDGSWLFGIEQMLQVHIWNAATSEVQRFPLPDRTKYESIHLSPGDVSPYLAVIASPTNPTRFAATDGDVAIIYDIQQKKILNILGSDDPAIPQRASDPLTDSAFVRQIHSLAWSPNGRYLAGCYMTSASIFIWDLQNPKPGTKNGVQMPDLTFHQKNGQLPPILDLAWSPDGRYLASASADSTVIIWRVDTDK